jgi:integrase
VATKTSNESTLKSGGAVTITDLRKASEQAVSEAKAVYLHDPAPRGSGRLQFRLTPGGGCLLSFRYTDATGARPSPIRLGDLDPKGSAESIRTAVDAARARAQELSRLYLSGVRDLAGYLDAEEAQRQGQIQTAREAAEAEERSRKGATLQALLDAYVDTLKGRESCNNVRSLFRLHLTEAWPDLVARKAADVKPGELRDVLALVVQAGKGRTADKLRAFLRAAYEAAMKAEFDPTRSGSFGAFSIPANPVDRLPAMPQFRKALDRTLTASELRSFWKCLKSTPEGVRKDAVMAALLLGGQRPAQLLRLRVGDVDLEASTLVIHDGKGRGRAAQPRRHVLPVPAELRPILARRLALIGPGKPDAPVFSSSIAKGPTREGKPPKLPKALRQETASELVVELCENMQLLDQLQGAPFTWRDLRRTCETRLAELGVSNDVLAQLLSHGLGGVQQRHYNRHDYLAEKRAALDLLTNLLNGTQAPALRAA